MKYIVGNLFDHIHQALDEKLNAFRPEATVKGIIIPHVCNDIGGWGSGFVVPLGNTFPASKENYHEWHDNNSDPLNLQQGILSSHKFELGKMQFVPVQDKIWVANMIAQTDLISEDNLKPLKYYALVKCLEAVRKMALRLSGPDRTDPNNVQIHAPKFGSDRAGGDWNVIEELITDIWAGINVTIYSLE